MVFLSVHDDVSLFPPFALSSVLLPFKKQNNEE